MPPPSSTSSKFVLRSLYRSLLRAAAPFSHPSPSAAAYASLIHRSGVAHDWEECVHKLDNRRRVAAAAASSRSGADKDKNNNQKETNLPKSWARNLARSYSDLQEEYALRKDYFAQRYGVEDHDDDDEWDDDDEAAMDLAMGSSSYYEYNKDYYNMEEDPKFILFRQVLREWFAASSSGGGGGGGGRGDDGTEDKDAGEEKSTTKLHWPREWTATEGGYYENGRIKQVPLMKFPSQIVNDNAGGGLSLRALIQREFHAPTAEERWSSIMEEESKFKEKLEASTTPPEVSSNDGGGSPTTTTTLKEIPPSSSSFIDTVEERLSKMEESKSTTLKEIYPSSSFIDTDIRIQTAFYTLRELNRKLAWAENIGFPPPAASSSSRQAMERERKYKRLVQAAKGVSHFSAHHFQNIETKKAISEEEPPLPSEEEPSLLSEEEPLSLPLEDDTNDDDNKPSDDDSSKISSSPLQCGTYLIAHPLMTGYFAKSVIVLLDHAEEVNNSTKTEEGSGGTYGLIINRLALEAEMAEEPSSSLRRQQWEILRQNWEEEKKSQSQRKEQQEEQPTTLVANKNNASFESLLSLSNPQKNDSLEEPPMAADTTTRSTIVRRPIALLQAINAEDLPETVQMAFGDAPVREGGPVNLSLQMIHRKTLEIEKKSDDQDCDPNTTEEEGGEKKEEEQMLSSSSKIGGTPFLGAEQQYDDKLKDSEETIYFRGDVVEASHAVLDGTCDRDDFSFIIGAACWAPGQLVNEIERGCWLPFHGPPQMTMTGMVDHNDVTGVPSSENDDDTKKGGTSKLSSFPPRPSNTPISSVAGSVAAKVASQQSSGPPGMRPVGDLWLSIMCALGEGEADLAYMMLDDKNQKDRFGDACDNFDR